MKYELKEDINFWDDEKQETFIIKKGGAYKALLKKDTYGMSLRERCIYHNAKRMYDKRGEKGLFLFIKNKYRWVGMVSIK